MENPEQEVCSANAFGLKHCYHNTVTVPRQADIKADHWRAEKQCCWCGLAVREVHGLKVSIRIDTT